METTIKLFCVNNFKTVIGLNYGVCQNKDASLESHERSKASFLSVTLHQLQWKNSQGTGTL